MLVRFTEYPGGLFDIDNAVNREMDLEEFVNYFSTHIRLARKEDGPGFGPYVAEEPTDFCTNHRDGRPRNWPHRCDSCVHAIQFAVFDVDVGTIEQIAQCDSLLGDLGVGRLWYTSFSYTPEKEKPPFRLIIFLSEPIQAEFWSAARKHLISQYKIPADPKRCSGLSHFYYLPSCPIDAEPYVDYRPGNPLDVKSIPQVKEFSAPRPRVSLDNWYPPEDPPEGSKIDISGLKEKLKARKRKFSVSEPEKAALLGKLLDGEALAEHGKRNDTMNQVCGMVAWALPGTPLSVLMLLLRPSLQKMIAEGSSLTEDEVERMTLTAMRAKAEYDARQEQNNKVLAAGLNSICSNIPAIE